MAEQKSYLGFRLGEESFAIPVDCVHEILERPRITPVPRSLPCMRGVVNVRGTATPVMDLRLRFGLSPQPDTDCTRIMVLHLLLDEENVVVGGLADAVTDVLEFSGDEISPPPRIGMRWRPDFVRGIANRQGRYYILLDIEKLVGSREPALVRGAASLKPENKEYSP